MSNEPLFDDYPAQFLTVLQEVSQTLADAINATAQDCIKALYHLADNFQVMNEMMQADYGMNLREFMDTANYLVSFDDFTEDV